MSHRSPEELRAELEAMVAEEDDRIGRMAQLYSSLKLLASEVSDAAKQAGRELQAAMEEQGLKRADAEGCAIIIKQRHTVGIKEGESPEDYLKNKELARAWVEGLNPTQPDIGTTNLKRTLDLHYEENGSDAPLPEFLREQDVPNLSVNRR